MKITIVTVSTTSIDTIIKINKEFKEKYKGYMQLDLFYTARELSEDKRKKMKLSIENSNAVLVDLMGSPDSIVRDVYGGLEKAKGQIIPLGNSARSYLRLGKLNADSMKKGMGRGKKRPGMETMKKMSDMAEKIGKVIPGKIRDLKNLSQISKYYMIADEYNIRNMLYLLLRDYGGHTDLPVPDEAREIPKIGICDPAMKRYFDTYDDYKNSNGFDENKPIVAVLYYGHTYPNDTSYCVVQIINKIKGFANVLPIAFSSISFNDFKLLYKILDEPGGGKVELLINFMSFRLGAGPMGGDAQKGVDLLTKLDVPYMHPFFISRRRVSEWIKSKQGITSSEFMVSVMLPELDGCIETIPVGAMCEPEHNDELDINIRRLELIEDRADKFVLRMKSQLLLRKKMNRDKRIAIICYNYPPGEGNVFGGSFLDTFESIKKILQELKNKGYTTDAMSKEELIESFTTAGIVNSARYFNGEDVMIKYSSEVYGQKISEKKYFDKIVSQWGRSPGKIMVSRDNKFLIPGIILGNIFIGLQPSRGFHDNNDMVYHDKEVLPHHQYMAYYRWLEDEFKADAMIHIGTHGTMEFLQGKECGMSSECFPDILVSEIPHMYFYYTGNPSEAMIAKRRSHANIISYQPPEYTTGDLYGDYIKLQSMIDEYREAKLISPVRSNDILKNIYSKAKEAGLPENLEEIEHELYRMNRSLIPKGLHVIGESYDMGQSINYARQLIRYDSGEIKSLRRIIAEDIGFDYDLMLDKNKDKELRKIDNKVDEIYEYFIKNNRINNSSFTNSKYKNQALKTLKYSKDVIAKCKKNNEIAGMFNTFNGRYNPSKPAGDIFRNPEVLPTGFNLYQFDPRFVPSTTAYQRGKKIAENTLSAFMSENGKLPDSTAVILWGLETSRTQGETVSQVLAYLGVRPASGKNIWEPKYEIIPLEELGRKRIDVVVSICGFFRDMFPNIIDSFNKIFEELAMLDEPDGMNCFKANTKEIYKKLISEGMRTGQAKELSCARIFGPGEARYGTGITGIIETKNWQDESQLGDEFINSIKHVYSKNHRGMEAKDLYKSNLKSVDIVSQIRSSHEYEVTDLDHYYEFFGGLAKSIEAIKGEKVKIYITDTTGEKMETETVKKSIGRGVRSRLLNPKWIDGVLEHEYHGVQKIADRFENIMGLAATTGEVEEWIYNDLNSAYLEDEEMQKRMKKNNPYAYIKIIEQMYEYYDRGYWHASEKQIDNLKKVYLETEGDMEEKIESKYDP
ncbi:MAG: magnesium chelatase subunit H [Actinomycetia bacterium]|nr:magnesium chelatase subunit H [Actinomycetes bacterium]